MIRKCSRAVQYCMLCWSSLIACFANVQAAQPFPTLQLDERATIQVVIEPSNELHPFQQAKLNVVLATPGWFSKGTKIDAFTIPGALVVKRNPFAFNETVQIHGRTHVRQTWEWVVYPLDAGLYKVPSIVAHVTTKLSDGIFDEPLVSEPLEFEVESSSKTEGIQYQFASSSVSLTQSWQVVGGSEKALSGELNIGDALIRKLTMTVQDSSVMLLPDLAEEIDRMSNADSHTRVLESVDGGNRGDYFAQQTIETTYIVKRAGEFVAPEIEVTYWDTAQGKTKTVAFSEQRYQVRHTATSFIKAYIFEFLLILMVLPVLVASLSLVKKKYLELEETSLLKLHVRFLRAWVRGSVDEGLFIFYQYRLRYRQVLGIGALLLQPELFQLCYRWQQNKQHASPLTRYQLWQLWRKRCSRSNGITE